jgi:uncharacterized protein YbcC (UPF0753/DUF2309 family)
MNVPMSLVIYLSCAFLVILGLAIWMLEREREAHNATCQELRKAEIDYYAIRDNWEETLQQAYQDSYEAAQEKFEERLSDVNNTLAQVYHEAFKQSIDNLMQRA